MVSELCGVFLNIIYLININNHNIHVISISLEVEYGV